LEAGRPSSLTNLAEHMDSQQSAVGGLAQHTSEEKRPQKFGTSPKQNSKNKKKVQKTPSEQKKNVQQKIRFLSVLFLEFSNAVLIRVVGHNGRM